MDLTNQIPILRRCTSIILTAGGPSLSKFADEIIEKLAANPLACLFDVNQHFSRRALTKLKELDNLKIGFSMDLGMAPVLEKESADFMALPNAWYVARAPVEIVSKLFPTDRYVQVPSAFNAEIVQKSEGVLNGLGGSLSYAYSAIPDHIEVVDIYGADSIVSPEIRSIEGGPQIEATTGSYKFYREVNRPGLKFLSEYKYITLHV